MQKSNKELAESNEELGQTQEELRSYIEELNSVNEELVVTVEEINNQRNMLQTTNSNITASINYAKRIQEAMLPSTDAISRIMPESFVLFRSKEIVSGDFYWINELKNDFNNKLLINFIVYKNK